MNRSTGSVPSAQTTRTPRIDWYFDFISPFAWLQWPRIRQLAEQRPLQLRPILFAGLLDLHGHKGPAEIASKRRCTYRQVWWRARALGRPLHFPPAHPFNPLAALRLCVAAGASCEATEAIFDWIWSEGRAGDSVDALRPVAERLGIADPAAATAMPAVKAALRENYDLAVAAGVFGVPTLAIDGELFWGEDAGDFALALLDHPALLQDPELQRLDRLPVGISRL
jgi:2-hydroxychromene-2-carboxylate isomerase